MASAAADETTTIREDDLRYDEDMDDDDEYTYGYDHHQLHPHNNLSRLSMCSGNSTYDDDDNYFDVDDVCSAAGVGVDIGTMLSRLSVESFDGDGDADEEFSDGDDKEPAAACYSLPATPPRRRYPAEIAYRQIIGIGVKEYASENEAIKRTKTTRRRRRKTTKPSRPERWESAFNWDHGTSKKDVAVADEEDMMMRMESVGGVGGGNWNNNYNHSNNSCFSLSGGESESGGGERGGGLMVITRPKGGRRSLCMDFEEVKACRDLGFELEHERMFEMIPSSSSRLSLSASTLDTASSGSNSPIANWRISSPGDDPRDVKARLKVWAQAVALASTSRQASNC